MEETLVTVHFRFEQLKEFQTFATKLGIKYEFHNGPGPLFSVTMSKEYLVEWLSRLRKI